MQMLDWWFPTFLVCDPLHKSSDISPLKYIYITVQTGQNIQYFMNRE